MTSRLPHWQTAHSFPDLCALGLRFLRGEPVGFPGWLPGELDEESFEYRATLERCAQRGLLTLASQEAHEERAMDGTPEERRAFVFGFAPASLALHLQQVALAAGLWSRHYAAGARGGQAWAVGRRGLDDFLLVGDAQGPAELELFEAAIGPGPALNDLARQRYLVLVDPIWGRPGRLWACLDRALR